MSEELPIPLRDDAALRGRDQAPTVEEPALSPHAAGLDRNRADEVHLDLEGRVTVTGRQRGMHAQDMAESRSVAARPPWTVPIGL